MNSPTASRRKNNKKPSVSDEPSSRPLKDRCTRSKKARYRKPNRTPTPCRLEQPRILTQSKPTSYKTQKPASRSPRATTRLQSQGRGTLPWSSTPKSKGYDMDKIFMDGGSSMNIIFVSTLHKMMIPRSVWKKSSIVLYGVVPGEAATS